MCSVVAQAMIQAKRETHSKDYAKAVSAALLALFDFIEKPSSDRLPVAKMNTFDVDVETRKLQDMKTYNRALSVAPANAIRAALEASFRKETQNLLKSFFAIVTDKDAVADAAEWDDPNVTKELDMCKGNMQSILKAITSISRIVRVTERVIKLAELRKNMTEPDIKEQFNRFGGMLDSIIADMTGDSSGDHEVLESYRPLMPCIITLLLSHENPSFPRLADRIRLIRTDDLYKNVSCTPAIIETLRNNLDTLADTVEQSGSVSEESKIRKFIKMLEENKTRLAIGPDPNSPELEIQLLIETETHFNFETEEDARALVEALRTGERPKQRHALEGDKYMNTLIDGMRSFKVTIDRDDRAADEFGFVVKNDVNEKVIVLSFYKDQPPTANIRTLFTHARGENLRDRIEGITQIEDNWACTVYKDLTGLLPIVQQGVWCGEDTPFRKSCPSRSITTLISSATTQRLSKQ